MKVHEFLEFLQINDVDIECEIFVGPETIKTRTLTLSSAFEYDHENKTLSICYSDFSKTYEDIVDEE